MTVVNQEWHRVPAVAHEFAGRAVVAHQGQNIGFQGQNLGQEFIKNLDLMHLLVEVAVLAGTVGFLHVEEEEIVLAPVLGQRLDLTVQGVLVAFHRQDFHAHQAGQALVHGVTGDAGGVQLVHVRETGEVRHVTVTTEQHAVHLRFVLQGRFGAGHESVHQRRGLLAGGVVRGGGHGLHAHHLRVDIADVRTQRLAILGAEHHHETVLGLGVNLHRNAVDVRYGGLQFRHDIHVLLVAGAASAAVIHDAVRAQRGEITTHRDIPRVQFHADTHRGQRPAPHHVLQRIVPEQAQVAGAATGRDARAHQFHQAHLRIRRQFVQVGGVRRGQFRLAVQFHGQAAHAVQHHQHDLALGLLGEATNHIKEVTHAP